MHTVSMTLLAPLDRTLRLSGNVCVHVFYNFFALVVKKNYSAIC